MIATILLTAFMVMVHNANAGNALQRNANSFGPYTVSWTLFDLCKGPKAKNLTSVEVDVRKNDQEEYICYMNFTLAKCKIDEIKIVVSSFKDNIKNILWTYNLKDPCQHFLFANIIEKNLNAHNCAVEKGNYVIELNLSELTTSFLGQSFFYGNYIMKATVLSKKGNILCVTTNMSVEKKVKEKAKETA